MTVARTPAGRGRSARPGRAAAERAEPTLQKTAAARPDGHIPLQGPAEAAALPPAPRTAAGGRAARHRPPLTDGPLGGSELWGSRSLAPRARCASALRPQLGPALPASPGPRRNGVGAAPRSRAMGRPLGTEQPP